MGFWQPVDAKPDQDFTWIDTNRLSKRLSTFTSRNILVVADSCFSGAVFRGADANSYDVANDTRAFQSLIDKRTRLALTSGGMEPVVDAFGGEENSIFAQEFMKSLMRNENMFSAGQLFDEVRSRVAARSLANGVQQVPEFSPLYGAGHDGGDFVFVRASSTY